MLRILARSRRGVYSVVGELQYCMDEVWMDVWGDQRDFGANARDLLFLPVSSREWTSGGRGETVAGRHGFVCRRVVLDVKPGLDVI